MKYINGYWIHAVIIIGYIYIYIFKKFESVIDYMLLYF